MIYFLLALFLIGLDQLTKWWVVLNMDLYESIVVIDQFFYITSHRNRGAAFGILQDQLWLFIGISSMVIVGILYYMTMMKREPFLVKLSVSFVLAGAVGNLIDRIRTGEVVDFFHFQFGEYHFPIFNVADSVIVIGVILLVCTQFFWSEWMGRNKQKTEDPQ